MEALCRCAKYASRGCKVYATARRMEAMDGLKQPNVEKLVLDVTDEENVRDVVETIISREGRIDVLVNNAGVLCIGMPQCFLVISRYSLITELAGPVIDVSMDVIQKAYDANVFSVIRMCKAVIPYMAARKSGTIVQISSVGAYMCVQSDIITFLAH